LKEEFAAWFYFTSGRDGRDQRMERP